MLALAAAPAIVRAESLMKIRAGGLLLPEAAIASPTFAEIVAITIRNHAAEMANNIRRNNALRARFLARAHGP